MAAGNTRPPLRMSAYGQSIERGGQTFFSIEGVTPAEYDILKVVLVALNTLDLSGPQARRAIVAVVRMWPSWRAGRSYGQLEALSR